MAFGRRKSARTAETPSSKSSVALPAEPVKDPRINEWVELKSQIRAELVEVLDSSSFVDLSRQEAVGQIRPTVDVLVAERDQAISGAMVDRLCRELIDEIIGLGPLESLITRDEIADIMVNGYRNVFIEVNGKVERAPISFSSDEQLLQICQRIVRQVGRRVDESSPICDARLLDGSRVNVIIPPLAIDGPTLTIRKFRKERLTLSDLVKFRSISRDGAELLGVISKIRCNTIISGGTGSGKTTLLNCLTGFIENTERIVTCEDAAELQLQQRHVVRLETRPPNIEGGGQISMTDLVRNCLRMRPDRIIVGEVRGSEAFDLLQAMNTGHDGSMGTLHANSAREALFRLESMIAASPAGSALPARAVREMIVSSVDVIVQSERLRDGRRVISTITEIVGMEEDTIVTQDLMQFQIEGTADDQTIVGQHRGLGVANPKFARRAVQYGEVARLADTLLRLNEGASA
ncbi:MAG: CpaF family protein [Gammaproteobacteria bacterium]|nr:CpaF family protein [Gammaproteobacteria bacterium]